MKKLIFTLFIALLSINLLSAQEIEVPQTQMSLVNKIAASWCPPCGSWGWDFFHELIDDNDEKAILFTAHHSGGLVNQVASSMTSNYNVSSQPRFVLNGDDQNVLSSSTTAKREAIQQAVNEHAETSPIVQTGFDATYRDDGMIHVNAKTTFFQDTEGEYYLGIYLVEKIVISYQASQGDNAEHKQIVREEFTGSDFGSLLTMGTISADITFDNQFSMPQGDYDMDNLEIVTIIWKKDGNTYEFVNANKDSDVQLEVVNSIENTDLTESSLNIFPNVVRDMANIQFQLNTDVDRAQIFMSDLQGKRVQEVFNGSLLKGEQNFQLERTANLPSGNYVISLNLDGQTTSRRVILE
jgi:hypothetical protein